MEFFQGTPFCLINILFTKVCMGLPITGSCFVKTCSMIMCDWSLPLSSIMFKKCVILVSCKSKLKTFYQTVSMRLWENLWKLSLSWVLPFSTPKRCGLIFEYSATGTKCHYFYTEICMTDKQHQWHLSTWQYDICLLHKLLSVI